LRPEDIEFEAGEVERLTGLTGRQLRLWDNTGLFPASGRTGDGRRRQGTKRLWSFRQVVVLRAVVKLRGLNISTQAIRKAFDYLRRAFPELGGDFAGVTFIVWGSDLLALPAHEQLPISALKQQGQRVIAIPIDDVRAEVAEAVRDLRWAG